MERYSGHTFLDKLHHDFADSVFNCLFAGCDGDVAQGVRKLRADGGGHAAEVGGLCLPVDVLHDCLLLLCRQRVPAVVDHVSQQSEAIELGGRVGRLEELQERLQARSWVVGLRILNYLHSVTRPSRTHAVCNIMACSYDFTPAISPVT